MRTCSQVYLVKLCSRIAENESFVLVTGIEYGPLGPDNCWKGGKNAFNSSGGSVISRVTWNRAEVILTSPPPSSISCGFQDTFCGVWNGQDFSSFLFFLAFVSFFTIFVVARAFYFIANDRGLWKEAETVCDSGIHGLEHYTSWIKGD